VLAAWPAAYPDFIEPGAIEPAEAARMARIKAVNDNQTRPEGRNFLHNRFAQVSVTFCVKKQCFK
jgi:hypothetical protein